MEDVKWGLYPWFRERGEKFIHPEDLAAFQREVNNCKVYECVEAGEYMTLRYGENCYRVMDQLFHPVPAPKFSFGQKVKILKSGEEVVITDIMWHFDRQQHYYFVASRKRKSKRYYESELGSVDAMYDFAKQQG